MFAGGVGFETSKRVNSLGLIQIRKKSYKGSVDDFAPKDLKKKKRVRAVRVLLRPVIGEQALKRAKTKKVFPV